MKKFLKRHSWIVLIIIAIVIAGTNYLVYPVFIKKELNLVEIPVAKTTINETTQISEDMLTTLSVAKEYLPTNIITDKNEIIGKYSNRDVTIAPNGFIYTDYLTDDATLFGETFSMLNDSEWAYTMPLSGKYNQNGEIKANEYVSMFFVQEYVDDNDHTRLRAGQLAENVRVISITEPTTDSQYLTLAIPEADIAYYALAERIGEIFPLVNFASNGTTPYFSEVYSIDATRQIIAEQNDIFNRDYSEDEEVVENVVVIDETETPANSEA